MKKHLLLIGILFCLAANAQPNYKITYLKTFNGKILENQDPILVFANTAETVITNQKIIDKKAAYPYEFTVIDRKKGNHITTFGNLQADKEIATVDSVSLGNQSFEFSNDTKSILGYNCKKAKTITNSNTIELWYTNDLPVKGGPNTLGQNLGLVLEVNRNGNFIISATKVEKIKSFASALDNTSKKKYTDPLTYRDLIWKSQFTTIPVFREQIINFSDASIPNDSVFRFANGTIAVRKMRFPEIKPGSQVFVDLMEQSNGDAYDRTGSVFIIPVKKSVSFLDGLQRGVKELPVYKNGNGKEYQGVIATNDYEPLLELMRFFTPFGIKQYNHIELKDKTWHEAVPYRQDISDLAAALSNQDVWIGVYIGNYDKGGHKVNLNITIHPEETAKKAPTVLPLFNTNNVMEMAGQEYGTMFNHEKGLEVSFVLEKDLKNAKLRYITTGHGGWENGDEFVPKKNTILLNDEEIFALAPWRQDCGSYRLFNPASGNFPNGLSSSDYSRANWCPGTATSPFYIDLGELKAGNYRLQIKIPQGAPEGNSFSSWNVSGALIGEYY